MKNWVRNLIAIGLLAGLNIFGSAAFAKDDQKCFATADLKDIAATYQQVADALKDKEKICDDGADLQWFKVIETLLDIKNYTGQSVSGVFKTKDDFSFEAIPSTGWWEYFSTRAKKFYLTDMCDGAEIARVNKEMFADIVFLCPAFTAASRPERIEVLMHEVRHLEENNIRHVDCTYGEVKGIKGACDQRLKDGGSYAVQMQVAISIGLFGKNFSAEERALARSHALNLLLNRFEEKTDVNILKGLYLENSAGEIFTWNSNSLDDPQFLFKLASPARIHAVDVEVVIYPLDMHVNAYRMTEDFSFIIPRLGMFATAYNSVPLEERSDFRAVGYNGDGGYVLGDAVYLNCRSGPLVAADPPEPIVNFISWPQESTAAAAPEDFLLGQSGKLYEKSCDKGAVTITETPWSIEPEMAKKSVSLAGQVYYLDSAGLVRVFVKKENTYEMGGPVFSGPNSQAWIDMTLRSIPALFAENAALHKE